MRLSEAGLMGMGLLDKVKAGTLHGCFLGAALKGIDKFNHVDEPKCYETLRREWPWLRREDKQLPCGCGDGMDYLYAIYHIFDSHVMLGSWTVEQLVDWIRSVEPPESSESAESLIAVNSAESVHV